MRLLLCRRVGSDNKIWRTKCLQAGWGGRVTSTHPTRKRWKEVYIQMVVLARQRTLQREVAKPVTLRGPRKIHLLFLGLDRAGKTTILYRLKLGRKIVSIPTVGANREAYTQVFSGQRGAQVERNFKITDVGGIQPMRALWPEYLKRDSKIDALVFVVDGSDHDR